MRRAIVRDRLLIACGVGASVAMSAAFLIPAARPGRALAADVMLTPHQAEGRPGASAVSQLAGEPPAALDATSTRVVGVVMPVSRVLVRAKMDGFIARRLKGLGDRVAAGDAVSLVDDAGLLLDRDKCKARAEAAA